jgi:hypothetical protein
MNSEIEIAKKYGYPIKKLSECDGITFEHEKLQDAYRKLAHHLICLLKSRNINR